MIYAIVTGLIVMIAVGMGVVLMHNAEQQKKQKALDVIKGRSDQGGTVKNKKDEQHKRRADLAKKLKEQETSDSEKVTISLLLRRAGLKISVKQYWLFSFVLSCVMALLGVVMGYSSFVILMMWITGLLGLPRMIVKMKIGKRQKKFLEEFADALEAMVRLLKAGMPVSEAIAMAGREFTGPVGEEMAEIYNAQKVGVPLPEAALAATKRMPLTEMQMFATGVAIQAQTGASLSEVLSNLAHVIRSRYKLKRKVQALSSEAKASAAIIGCLPLVVGGGMYMIEPEHIGLLFTSNTGRFMLIGSAIWMGIGIFIMKVMINFKV